MSDETIVKTYSFKVNSDGSLTSENPSIKVDALVKRFMYDNNVKDYSVALRRVLADHKELAREYAGV